MISSQRTRLPQRAVHEQVGYHCPSGSKHSRAIHEPSGRPFFGGFMDCFEHKGYRWVCVITALVACWASAPAARAEWGWTGPGGTLVDPTSGIWSTANHWIDSTTMLPSRSTVPPRAPTRSLRRVQPCDSRGPSMSSTKTIQAPGTSPPRSTFPTMEASNWRC